MIRRWIAAAAIVLAGVGAARSEILIEYHAASGGGFIVANQAACALGDMRIVIDLAGSEGDLTFSSGATLTRAPSAPRRVATGGAPSLTVEDQTLTLDLIGFAPGERIAIRTSLASDYDEGETALYDRPEALIAGAEAAARTPGAPPRVALFGADGRAMVETASCST